MLATRCLLLTIAAALTPAAPAADLTKVDRTLKKEPAYASKKPRYCLLVFGPEAKTCVWLVLDGKVLYADKNGNGDLTEAGEQVEAKEERGGLTFAVGDIKDGPHSHTGLTLGVMEAARLKDHLGEVPGFKKLLADDPSALLFALMADVSIPGFKGGEAGGRVKQGVQLWDSRGVLQFAAGPREAPVIHFGGSWVMAALPHQRLTRGRDSDLNLGFGTPGLGAGTFVYTGYEGLVPEAAHPVVEITFPPREKGQEPVRAKYTLKQRC